MLLLFSERTCIYNHILSVDSRLETMLITTECLILQMECVLRVLLSLNIFVKQLVINSDGDYSVMNQYASVSFGIFSNPIATFFVCV